MRVEVTTALCGEEAVRVARQKHFHLITMDQTLSPAYCKSVHEKQGSLRAERLAQEGGASDDALGSFDAPDVLAIDADRLQTAKRRTEFFNDELMHHLVRDCHRVLPEVPVPLFQATTRSRGVSLLPRLICLMFRCSPGTVTWMATWRCAPFLKCTVWPVDQTRRLFSTSPATSWNSI